MQKYLLPGVAFGALLLPATLFAQGQCVAPSQCVTPDACAAPPYCYVCPDREEDLGDEEEGQFMAGPPTGEYIGESESFGVRGFRIRLPEISFELPSIQFPSLFHSRRNAEVRTDSQVASFSRRQPIPLGAMLGDEDLGDKEDDDLGDDENGCYRQMYPCPPACAVPRGCASTDVQRLEQQVTQLQGLVEQLATLHMQRNSTPTGGIQQSTFQQPVPQPISRPAQVTANTPPQTTPGATPFEIIECTQSRRGCRPATDTNADRQAEIERQTAEYNQKCQEVDALRAQVAEMQRQYQLMLEMQQNELFRQREERLRSQFNQPSTQPAAARHSLPTQQARPIPSGYSSPNRQPESRPDTASAGESVFGQPTRAQASYNWQFSPQRAEAGVARLSN